ncbi:hypothetical protein [Paenibacillus sp. ATY16]|uniref:hypothetical protein n=1 Tax=Paenibacillus sp. ATY16 TaxID=1759312 RepID=UPI00200D451D|nr:hypothetical protein [Paenibacillus sp. ATY16]MCK9858204.1 hypothetical protein [Paenibacillus sp. ATY16]
MKKAISNTKSEQQRALKSQANVAINSLKLIASKKEHLAGYDLRYKKEACDYIALTTIIDTVDSIVEFLKYNKHDMKEVIEVRQYLQTVVANKF